MDIAKGLIMPKLLRDFCCQSCGREYEKFIDTETHYITCDCGEKAQKVIGMPVVKLEGITGAFPGAHDKWARVREDNARIKARRDG